MGLGLTSWNFLLLLFLLWTCRISGRELKEEPLPQMDVHIHAHHDHTSHMDTQAMLFFHFNDLKVGKKMPFYFPKINPSTTAHFFPREEVDSIPFSLKQLPSLLEFFSISPDSNQAKAMEDTLKMCESEPIKGEIKLCATSLESLLDFARTVLGLEANFKALTTVQLTKSSTSTSLQNYKILEVPEEIPASKMVACHYMSYPYAIYGCHSQMTEKINKVFRVSLGSDNGDRVSAIAVCHMDTSQWNSNHVSFQILGIKPGTSPVCHYIPTDNLVFVPVIKE